MVTRRDVLAAFAAMLTLPLRGAAAETQEREDVTFVRRTYQRQILRDVRNVPMTDAELQAVFTNDVRRLLQSPVPPRPDVPIGPKLHAFYGPVVLPGSEVTLHGYTPGEGTVAVDIKIRGVPRRLVVHPVREDGEWRIANIVYGPGEDFVSYHRKLRGQ